VGAAASTFGGGGAGELGKGGAQNQVAGASVGGALGSDGGSAGRSGSAGSSSAGSSSAGNSSAGNSSGGVANGGATSTGGSSAGADGSTCEASAGLVLGPDGCVPVAPPRLIAPLSTSRVTSHSPTLRWLLAPGTDGVHVQMCRTRACTLPVLEFEAPGDHIQLPTKFKPGVYFWRAFGRSAGVTGLLPSATWQFTVGHHSAKVDTSWGTTFDVNGDGYADALIGAPAFGAAQSQANPGHARVFMGSAAGLSSSPAVTLSGPGGRNQFGVVSSAGDVNGDGFADAIIGARAVDNYHGAAFVYLGGANGLSTTPITTIAAPSGGSFGWSVASAGDLNSDGYADVVVGAPYVSKGGVSVQYGGRAYVYFGGPSGLDTATPITLAGSTDFGGVFGQNVGSAGDVDGDGRADLLVSGQDGIPVGTSAYTEAGRAYLFLGAASPFGAAASAELHAPSEQTPLTFGGAGDFNADGYADLVLGALGETTELLGSATGFGTAGSLSQPFPLLPNTTASYSYRVVAAGDLDGDGYDEIVTSYDSIYTYSGGARGAVSPAASFTPPGESATIYGYHVIPSGDINGDGFDDLVIGAPFADNFTGRAYVYFGSAAGLAASPALILLGTDGPGGNFG